MISDYQWKLATLKEVGEEAVAVAKVELNACNDPEKLRGRRLRRAIRGLEMALADVDMAIVNIREVLP